MNFRESARKIGKGLVGHLVDTTALLGSTLPIYAALEVGVIGMSNEVSIGAKIAGAELSYLGIGFVFSKGRDFSRNFFKISDNTSEKLQALHDGIYTAAFNSLISPAIYLSKGASVREALIGGATVAALSPLTGPIMGYAVDIGRDLTGLGECNRALYPDFVKRQSPAVKKGLAALLTSASIGTLATIYALNAARHAQDIQPIISADYFETTK